MIERTDIHESVSGSKIHNSTRPSVVLFGTVIEAAEARGFDELGEMSHVTLGSAHR